MTELHVTLTEEERLYLQELLKETLKGKRLEEHRTRTPSYREYVLREESLAESVLGKLQPVPV